MSHYSLQPICPVWVIAMWGLVCLGLILHAWRRQQATVPLRIRLWLLGLRLIGLVFLMGILLRPWQEKTIPQPGASRVVFLVDASPSMFDCKDAIEVDGNPVRRWDAACATLPDEYPWKAELLRFGENGLVAWPKSPSAASALPGDTPIGKALDEALDSQRRPGALPLAAIVLFSDGHETASDSSLIEAAKHARAQQIPVSTLTFGSSAIPPNAKVSIPSKSLTVLQGENLTLPVQVTSDFPTPFQAQVSISDETGRPLATQSRQVEADRPTEFAFELDVGDTPGEHAYTATLSGFPAQDGRPDDNQDTVVVHIEAPPHYRLLYLADNPLWEWRFLRTVAENTKDLEISAIIRIGRDPEAHAHLPTDFQPARLFHRINLHEDAVAAAEDRGFPTEPSEYAAFDAVVLECTAASSWTEEQCSALLAFVERRGGGVLLTGNPETLPEALRRLTPVGGWEEHQATVRNSLLVNREFIFEAEGASRLGTGKLALPIQTRYWGAHSQKPAARVAIRDENGDILLAAMGNYGAGRVAWLGLTETWRWCLAETELDGQAIHREFWETLLNWLSQNRQPILRAELPAEEVATGKPAMLGIWVTGPDFLPAPAAQVQARIRLPDQTSQVLAFSPSSEEIGFYQAEFIPPRPGAYTVEFTALATPDAIAVSTQAIFLARNLSREAQESAACPEIMSDIARMTNGVVLQPPIHWSKLPLAEQIPRHVVRHYFLENGWFLFLLVLIWGTEWWLRRRHGLK